MNHIERDDERWHLIQLALRDPDLSDRAKLIAIGSVVLSRAPYLADDLKRARKLVDQFKRESHAR